MPDLELQGVSPLSFNCEGGLVLNRSTFIMQPGQALELENFEPDVGGGYKRLLGLDPTFFKLFLKQLFHQRPFY